MARSVVEWLLSVVFHIMLFCVSREWILEFVGFLLYRWSSVKHRRPASPSP